MSEAASQVPSAMSSAKRGGTASVPPVGLTLRPVLEGLGWAAVLYLIYVGLDAIIQRALFMSFVLNDPQMNPAEALDPFNVRYFNHPAAVGLHLGPGLLVMVLGPLQFIRRVRKKWIGAHRWSGRAFLLAGGIAAMSGIAIGVFDSLPGRDRARVQRVDGHPLLLDLHPVLSSHGCRPDQATPSRAAPGVDGPVLGHASCGGIGTRSATGSPVQYGDRLPRHLRDNVLDGSGDQPGGGRDLDKSDADAGNWCGALEGPHCGDPGGAPSNALDCVERVDTQAGITAARHLARALRRRVHDAIATDRAVP